MTTAEHRPGTVFWIDHFVIPVNDLYKAADFMEKILGGKPDGMTMEMSDNSMTTAKRDYTRGAAQLHASVVTGPAAAGALAMTKTGMNIETTEGHMISTTMNGFAVAKSYNTGQKSGAVMVALGPAAMFSVSYNSLTEDEALPLAQKFDWKAFQAASQQK